MSLVAFRRSAPSFLAAFQTFVANAYDRRRYLLTFKDGAHLIGVPTVSASEDLNNPNAIFDIATAVALYAVPFKLLAYAQQLVESGLRPSDGQPSIPEPC